MEERDLLPVRFGTLVADEQAAARAPSPSAARSSRPGSSACAAPWSWRCASSRASASRLPETESGREYLRAKIARMETARRLHEPLAALARDSVVQPGRELLRAAYLVDRDAVEDSSRSCAGSSGRTRSSRCSAPAPGRRTRSPSGEREP